GRAKVGPGPPAGQRAGMRIGLIAPIAMVQRLHRRADRLIQWRQGRTLIVATPYGYGRMIPKPSELLVDIGLESRDVVRQIGMRIQPEVVPYHDAVFVTGIIEGFIGCRPDPV